MSTSGMSKISVVGTDVDYNDINQGYLGDCYFLSAAAAVAEYDYRLLNAIYTPNVNKAGLFALQVYIKGIPQVVAIDDYIGFSGY